MIGQYVKGRRGGKLSSKPSTLIGQVVHDVESLLERDDIKWDMSNWCYDDEKGKCYVCIAGASILSRLTNKKDECVNFNGMGRQFIQLLAVNNLRLSLWYSFLSRFNIYDDDLATELNGLNIKPVVNGNKKSIAKWCVDVMRAASVLKKAGH